MNTNKFKTIMSRVGISYFLLLIFANMAQIGFMGIVLLLFPSLENEGVFYWLVSYVPLYAFCVPVFMLILNILLPTKKFIKQPLKFNALSVVSVLIISYGATYFFNFITIAIQSLITLITGAPMENPVENMLMESGLFWTAVFSCIVAPIGEELLFRKVLFNKVGPLGDKVYIITSGVLFGLFHTNIAQIFYACALGMIFAYVYSKTCKIIYPILLHMAINFVGTVVSTLSLESEILSIALTVFIFASIAGGIVFLALVVSNKKIKLSPPLMPLPQNYEKYIFANFGMMAYILLCVMLSIIVILISH